MTPGIPERSRPETCLSDRILDRLIVGELAGRAELAAVEGHLASCAVCRRRRAEIEAEPLPTGEPLWRRSAAVAVAPAAQAAPAAKRRRRAGQIGGLAALAMAAAAVVVLVRARPGGQPDRAPEWPPAPVGATQIKGPPFALDVVVRRRDGGRVEPLLPDSALREGDALRFRVRVPRPGYLAVLDIDGRGRVSPYAPRGGGALPVSQAGEFALDGSVVLDNVPGDERLIAVLCANPEEVARSTEVARAALRRAGGAPAQVTRLDLDCLQAHVGFRKLAPP
jgi:hypothetical protein